ncbi:MAG: fasciclin domain-containing protein [Deltaproteobacteria bacterium]
MEVNVQREVAPEPLHGGDAARASVGDAELAALVAIPGLDHARGKGLTDDLSGAGPFTVLAPTNEAFTALGMLPSGDALTNVLLYHVVGEPLSRYQASITRAATPCTASVKSWW